MHVHFESHVHLVLVVQLRALPKTMDPFATGSTMKDSDTLSDDSWTGDESDVQMENLESEAEEDYHGDSASMEEEPYNPGRTGCCAYWSRTGEAHSLISQQVTIELHIFEIVHKGGSCFVKTTTGTCAFEKKVGHQLIWLVWNLES